MLRSLLAGVLVLVFAPAAFAGGPSPGVVSGGSGVIGPGGATRYVTVLAGPRTALEAVRVRDGRVVRFGSFPGRFAIPLTTYSGSTGGVSADGLTVVLADASRQSAPLRSSTSFLAVFTKTFETRATITLQGDFAFDALSPDGKTLYLIQHLSPTDTSRYVVRAYDVDNGILLSGSIADKSQRGWVMAGAPVARATGPGGRWVYTLYQRTGGTPFVHALDTMTGVAHCTGIPWTGDQAAIWNLRLSLGRGGHTLAIHWRNGDRFMLMDTRSWRLSTPHSGGFAWAILAAAIGGALALLIAAGLLRRALHQGTSGGAARVERAATEGGRHGPPFRLRRGRGARPCPRARRARRRRSIAGSRVGRGRPRRRRERPVRRAPDRQRHVHRHRSHERRGDRALDVVRGQLGYPVRDQ